MNVREALGFSLVLSVAGVPWTSAFHAAREGAESSTSAPQNDSIRREDVRADLYFLASDEMRGRLTATPENRLAAEFIKSRFERLGLKPLGPEGSYFQSFNLVTATLGGENRLHVIQGENASLRLNAGQDFYPLRFSASGTARGNVVFAGFGITAPKLSYDDYRGSDVRGKIVLVLDHEPGESDPESPFDGVVSSAVSDPLQKALSAQDKGALGILFVQDVHNHPGPADFEGEAKRYWPPPPQRRERFALASFVEKVRIPAAQISPSLAEILLRTTGRSFQELAQASETEHGAAPVPIPGAQVEIAASVERHIVPDRNVLGLLEGSDPILKDEWVVLCAHYDHSGAEESRVFNGADDDGSGTVGVIEIAEAYALAAREGVRPRRSILFAAWNTEESGLLGAWAYTERPPHPLSRTVAVLNMDMIGRNEEVPEGGGRRFRGLEVQTAESNRNTVSILGGSYTAELLAEIGKANQAYGLDLEAGYDNNVSNLLRRSDQWPFLQRAVPAVLITTGLHPDYHTEYDRPEKVNYEKMEKILRLVHHTSWNLAQQDGRPNMNK